MFKLMKYEIRGTYKFVLATILLVALATVGIQYTMLSFNNDLPGRTETGLILMIQVLLPILVIVIMAASIAFIVYLIQSYRKELYEDRGYLTFTLPISGKKILGAKFITAVLWYTVFGLITVGINIFAFRVILGGEIVRDISFQLSYYINELGRGLLSGMLLYGAVSSLATLLTIYFSITLSKVAIKNRNIGGLWIIIFLLINGIFNLIEGFILRRLPMYTTLARDSGIISANNLSINQSGLLIHTLSGSPAFSLTGAVYWLIIGVGLFLLTSYLLDRKIEL